MHTIFWWSSFVALLPVLVVSVPLDNGQIDMLQSQALSSAELERAFLDWCAKYNNQHLIGTSAFETFANNLSKSLMYAVAQAESLRIQRLL
jgi:hypothetical protein